MVNHVENVLLKLLLGNYYCNNGNNVVVYWKYYRNGFINNKQVDFRIRLQCYRSGPIVFWIQIRVSGFEIQIYCYYY